MNPITIAFNQMAEQLEERSDGRLKITLYPNNTLGDTRANIESMQNGSVQIGEGSIAPLAMFTDAYMPFTLPFLFEDWNQVWAFGLAASHLADMLEKTKTIIVEVNTKLPWVNGLNGCEINIKDVDFVVEGDNPPVAQLGGGGEPTEVDQAVARMPPSMMIPLFPELLSALVLKVLASTWPPEMVIVV